MEAGRAIYLQPQLSWSSSPSKAPCVFICYTFGLGLPLGLFLELGLHSLDSPGAGHAPHAMTPAIAFSSVSSLNRTTAIKAGSRLQSQPHGYWSQSCSCPATTLPTGKSPESLAYHTRITLAALDLSGSPPYMHPTFLPHVLPLVALHMRVLLPERLLAMNTVFMRAPMHPRCSVDSPSPGARLPLATVVLRRQPAKALLKESLHPPREAMSLSPAMAH